MKLWFKKWNYHKERGYDRICAILDPLDKKELKEWISKFFEWEKKYEDMWYFKRHTLTTSLLFSCFVEYTEKKGKKLKSFESEDFLAHVHKWKGYTFKLYVGQGSFWRIEKDGKIIFQTT
jgi:hypothetical protein